MGFKDMNFQERMKKSDDLSRIAADKYFKSNNIEYVKLGFDTTGGIIPHFYHYPKFIRQMPDLAVIEPNNKSYLVELKGFASSAMSIKTDKIDTYDKWNNLVPLKYFLNKSNTKQVCYIPHDKFMSVIYDLKAVADSSMEGDYHYKVPFDRFEWENIN